MTTSSAFSSTARSLDSMLPTQPVGMKRLEKIASRSALVDLVPLNPMTPTTIITIPVNAKVANSLAFTDMFQVFITYDSLAPLLSPTIDFLKPVIQHAPGVIRQA